MIANNTPAKARSLGIAVVYQQPALFPELTVAENIALTNEGTRWFQKVNWARRQKRAAEWLKRVGARVEPDQIAGTLSMPEQQLVEIAKAIDCNPSVLIFDEPTASLGDSDTEHLFQIIGEMRGRGVAIVYVSHRFDELFRIADRVTILRDGCSIEEKFIADTNKDELIRLMVGRDLSDLFPRRKVEVGVEALKVDALTSSAAAVRGVSLTVHRGEILGLAGLVGSGRTQFAEALFGLSPVDSGTVSVGGKHAAIRSPSDAMKHGLAYLPEDRRRHGVVLDMSIASNTTMASLPAISSRGFLDFDQEKEIAAEYVRKLAVKTPSIDTPARNLSGGNQQKVALARWLLTKPSVLILDEPTQGIDVGAKTEIYDLIERLAEGGTAILMISSDMNEILGMSDRIAVMARGSITATVARADATPVQLLELALGHVPQASRDVQ